MSKIEKPEPLTREFLIQEVDALADRLLSAGDMAAFEAVFATRDIHIKASTLTDDQLRWIYKEYVSEEEADE